MSNRNYTNYSKQNKPAETKQDDAAVLTGPIEVLDAASTETPEPKTDENVQNIQETPENTEPATNATPEPQPEPEAPKAIIGVVVNCEKLNIRAEAKADAKILGTFFKGQEIEIYLDTSTDEFYDVNVGFCMKKYIEINK